MLDENFKPSLRFMVVSDIHLKDEKCIEEERFASAIKYAYSISKSSNNYNKLDAIIIVGDFANSGTEIQMQKAKNILDNCVNYNETQVIISYASHETNCEGTEIATERMKRILDQDPDQHAVINGFHFVSVSPSRSCNYDDDKIKWMSKQLKVAAETDRSKPIFVFQHPHNTDTVYGSILWGEDELIHTYMDYPQIIHFSGHSHCPINDPRSIYQKHFTCLGTGTLSYFELDEFDKEPGTIPDNHTNAAQMLIVEADADNRVRIYPFDVLTGNFFPQTHKIDTPSDIDSFIYTDKRYKTGVIPYFAKESKISVLSTSETSVKIKFDQALIDEDYVNCYDIAVKDSDGYIVRHLSIWSEYYFYDMPKSRTVEISGLMPQTEYTINIKACGFWNNYSNDCLATKIKTL